MSDIDDILNTADMLEIVASGGNGAELVDLPWLLGVAIKELRETDRLRAEVERLTRQADYLANDRDGYVQLLTDENNHLRAKNERLRAALELFACNCTGDKLCKFPHACRNYVARAALEESKE